MLGGLPGPVIDALIYVLATELLIRIEALKAAAVESGAGRLAITVRPTQDHAKKRGRTPMTVSFAGVPEAVVEEWVSAGGANRPDDQRRYLARLSDAQVVAELRRHWHVENVTDAELVEAVRDRRRKLLEADRLAVGWKKAKLLGADASEADRARALLHGIRSGWTIADLDRIVAISADTPHANECLFTRRLFIELIARQVFGQVDQETADVLRQALEEAPEPWLDRWVPTVERLLRETGTVS